MSRPRASIPDSGATPVASATVTPSTNPSFLVPLACITLFALLLRLAGLGRPSLWFDEALEWSRAAGSLATTLFGQALDHDPPLLPLAYHVWVRLVATEWWLRLPSVLAGTAAVALTGLWAARLFGRRIGLLAALFGALAPVAVYYGQELNQYAWVLLLTVASLWTFERLLESGTRRAWLLYGTIAALGLGVYYGMVFPLAAQGLYLLRWTWRRRDTATWRRLAIYVVACGIVCASLWAIGLDARIGIPHAVRRWGWPDPVNEWAFFHDVFWREVLVFYLLPFSGGPALVAVRVLALAALGGAVWLWRRFDGGPRAVTVGCLLPLALTYVASGWALYPFGFRHGLFVVPVLLTALAGAVAWLWRRWRPVGIAATVTVVALFLAFSPQRFWPNPWMSAPREDMRSVAAGIAKQAESGDLVYIYDPARYAFRYYWPDTAGVPVIWGDAFAGAEVIHEAWHINRTPADRAWLVFSHVEGAEDAELLDALADRGWREVTRLTAEGAWAVAVARQSSEGNDNQAPLGSRRPAVRRDAGTLVVGGEAGAGHVHAITGDHEICQRSIRSDAGQLARQPGMADIPHVGAPWTQQERIFIDGLDTLNDR
jgi:4-amino-4-deoxy-L-arabinose transferase-like glycosyltransferase